MPDLLVSDSIRAIGVIRGQIFYGVEALCWRKSGLSSGVLSRARNAKGVSQGVEDRTIAHATSVANIGSRPQSRKNVQNWRSFLLQGDRFVTKFRGSFNFQPPNPSQPQVL